MNARFEAGHTRPPLQPGEILSRASATSSRERFSQKAVFEAAENFRTGPEGLFAAVRGELAQTIKYIPQPHLPLNPNQIITVAIASSNNKKTDSILEHVVGHKFNVERFPEADELHTKNAVEDAMSKALSTEGFIQNQMGAHDLRRDIRIRPHVIIANDQLNAVPVITEHPITHAPVIRFERLGKPERDYPENPTESVRKMFGKLSEMAQQNNWPSVPYLTELATVIYNPSDPKNTAVNLQRSAIFLSVDGLTHLATDRFEEYIKRVKEQAGRANGKADATSLAGGFELQVLDDMGIVEFVSGTVKEIETSGFPPVQRSEAKEHAYRLALGSADEKLITEYFAQTTN